MDLFSLASDHSRPAESVQQREFDTLDLKLNAVLAISSVPLCACGAAALGFDFALWKLLAVLLSKE